MDTNQISQFSVLSFLLIIIGALVFSLLATWIGWAIVNTVWEYDPDHPIATFLIIWLIPFGFFVGIFRNSMVDIAKRRLEAQADQTERIIEEIQYLKGEN